MNSSINRIRQEYKNYIKEPSQYYSIELTDCIYKWNLLLFGPLGTIFEGGIFKATIEFSESYPITALKFKFIDIIPHPNIYTDGRICISILHDGVDEYNYEKYNERWSPAQCVHSVIMSILNLLIEPNFESSANIDATLLWKNNYNEYKKLIYKINKC
jgi:ubiquitin-protein ligase